MKLPASVRSWVRAVVANGAVRSAGLLVGGTAASQLITILALPFLTRLYTPEDFNILAVYTGFLMIFAIAATGRFDVAIPLPESDDEAANLLVLAVLCSTFTAVVLGLAVWLFGAEFARAASIEEAEPYFWLVPISIFLSGSFFGIQNWYLRRRAFGLIAATRVNQTIAGLAAQLGLGAMGWKPIGLLFGQLIISGAGSIKLMRNLWRNDRRVLRSVDWRSLRSTAYKHRQFPQYSVGDALAANAGNQIPMIIIAGLAIGPQAGLLLLTMRLLGAPVQLIAGAVSQVYLSSVGKAHQEGRLHVSTEKLVRALMYYGAAPLLFGSFAAAPLFGIVFGKEWSGAGHMMLWVAPWYALRMLSFPLTSVPAVVGRQGFVMVTKVVAAIFRIGAVYAGFYYWGGHAVEALALASMAHCLFLMAQFYSMAGVRPRALGVSFIVIPVVAAVLGLGVAELISLSLGLGF